MPCPGSLSLTAFGLERATRLELVISAWEALVLPLHKCRLVTVALATFEQTHGRDNVVTNIVNLVESVVAGLTVACVSKLTAAQVG